MMQSAAPSPEACMESGNEAPCACVDCSGETGIGSDLSEQKSGGSAGSPVNAKIVVTGPEAGAGIDRSSVSEGLAAPGSPIHGAPAPPQAPVQPQVMAAGGPIGPSPCDCAGGELGEVCGGSNAPQTPPGFPQQPVHPGTVYPGPAPGMPYPGPVPGMMQGPAPGMTYPGPMPGMMQGPAPGMPYPGPMPGTAQAQMAYPGMGGDASSAQAGGMGGGCGCQHGGGSSNAHPKFDAHKYGQFMDVINGFVTGEPDVPKLMGLLESADTSFWKGAAVGVATAFIFNNAAVKNAVSNAFSGLTGSKADTPAK